MLFISSSHWETKKIAKFKLRNFRSTCRFFPLNIIEITELVHAAGFHHTHINCSENEGIGKNIQRSKAIPDSKEIEFSDYYVRI